MKVLVVGGTGVIGNGLIPALRLANAERIRLLSRHALEDAAQWEGVEPYPADITDPEAVAESSEGCDVVVHIAGIEEEQPPDVTFDKVNVRGTELVVSEAVRGGVRKLVFISTIHAERPATDYQRSKSKAEAVVRTFPGEWAILRPSAVYGPGDRHISVLLRMVRTYPAIPIPGDGSQCIQPIWYEDFGAAIVRTIERNDISHATLSLGGNRTTVRQLLEVLMQVTGKRPVIVPLPEGVAIRGAALAKKIGYEPPVSLTQLRLALQGSCIEAPQANALVGTLGIDPIALAESLAILADSLPEQLPAHGVGRLRRKIFQSEIWGEGITPDGLFAMLREELPRLMPIPITVGPGWGLPLEEGMTLTAELPFRGSVQMRVEQVEDHHMILVTVEGHPLAAAVRFLTEARPGGANLRIEIYSRPADLPHWVAMQLGSNRVQTSMWETLLANLIRNSGGKSPGVRSEETDLDEVRSVLAEDWIKRVVDTRLRER